MKETVGCGLSSYLSERLWWRFFYGTVINDKKSASWHQHDSLRPFPSSEVETYMKMPYFSFHLRVSSISSPPFCLPSLVPPEKQPRSMTNGVMSVGCPGRVGHRWRDFWVAPIAMNLIASSAIFPSEWMASTLGMPGMPGMGSGRVDGKKWMMEQFSCSGFGGRQLKKLTNWDLKDFI